MPIDLTGHPPFFADVLRSPELEQTSPGCFRARFLSLRTYFSEFVILFLISALLVHWMAQRSSPWIYLVLAVLPLGYLVAGYSMKRLGERLHLEIRNDELWVGSPKIERVGRIREVVFLEIPAAEDEWRDENGSSRIYLNLEGCAPEYDIFPLLISSGVSLKKLGRKIAEVANCGFSQGKGRSCVPR